MNIFFGKIIITNPDGLEFKRSKWPLPVRLYWRFADFMAAKLSDYIVADSASIGNHFRYKYNFDASKLRIIEYGAHVNSFFDNEILDKYLLKHKEYYLVVCRFEPENNLHVILDGFIKADPKYKIVVVGNHSVNRYGRNLIRKFQSDKIIFTGGIYDKPELAALRYSCRAYLHGHSVGGTNPSLLEAMASSNPIICHDNVFNLEVTADNQLYFRNAGDCAQRISEIEKMDETELSEYGKAARQRIAEYYNWDIIGNKYLDFLDNIIRKKIIKK
ncbi:MAG: glycosyltransferase family 1 protein [Bacteroidales bacterium]|nr:glycosyltransferase family 1 protein [Bacteroidales bacterium]